MEAILDSINADFGQRRDYPPTQTALKGIRAALESPLNTTDGKAKTMAGYCRLAFEQELTTEPVECHGQAVSEIQKIIRQLSLILPANHPWQDATVKCMHILHEEPGEFGGIFEASEHYFVDALRSNPVRWGMVEEPANIQQDIEKWKNLNSFLARVTGTAGGTENVRGRWIPWSKDALHRALNVGANTNLEADIIECYFWVATEWLLCAAYEILVELSNQEGEPVSSKWRTWMDKLIEACANRHDLGLSDEVYSRILDAVRSMAVAEARLVQT
jgi:hypothetical protein